MDHNNSFFSWDRNSHYLSAGWDDTLIAAGTLVQYQDADCFVVAPLLFDLNNSIMRRPIFILGSVVLFSTSAFLQKADAANTVVNVRRELRKCSSRRRRYRRLVSRKRMDYHYMLTTKDGDGFWDAAVVISRGAVQVYEEEVEKDRRKTILQVMNDICRALRVASASPNSRQFFNEYVVRWRRFPSMSRVFYPTVAQISYQVQDDADDVGSMRLPEEVDISYQIKDFRLGKPDDAGIACPMDTRTCKDGSFSSREPPNCEFAACPGDTDNVFCTNDVKECDDGSFVNRDRLNSCRFHPCKSGPSRAEILSQKAKWLTNFDGTLDYEFTLQRTCYCTPDFVRPRRVIVKGGEVIEVRFADGEGGDTSDLINATPTIEELFDSIAAGADSWYKLAVIFDAESGFPESIDIDEDDMIADEERNIVITDVVIT